MMFGTVLFASLLFVGWPPDPVVSAGDSANWIESILETVNLEREKRQADTGFCPNPMTRYSDSKYPTDCFDILRACAGQHPSSGQYEIKPYGHDSIQVYCDMETDGGGWTVFQRRLDGTIDFYRSWNAYKVGFGNMNTEFWLGNDNIHFISTQGEYELSIDLTNSLGNKYYAKYQNFRVGDELANYILLIGQYSGTTGDSLTTCHLKQFSTYDRDNDQYSSYNQASRYRGAWWLSSSIYTQLNGNYYGYTGASSIYWSLLPGDNDNIIYTEMKMRPMNRKY
ncbi:fibrinogen-like protein A [Apostichopus japonicus]|uniref:fibrinogen-like protein A n=1 Tax=Stichopus japonicus TaxID=307972 RepID=UPI003AB86E5B